MMRSLRQHNPGSPLSALTTALWLGMAMTPVLADDDAKTVKQLLDLTDGRRVKVAWNQGTEQDMKLHFLDTKDGTIRDLPFSGSAPLITSDGRHVVASAGKATERKVMLYDTETKKVTELAKGPSNNLMAVWQDPKAKRTWIYVNDAGDKGEAWNAPAGKIYRFPLDKPDERELFWDRTSSHIYLMFSADGTRACFEPSWENIGQLKIAYDAKGKVDQEKSVYTAFGGGCFPSMAPDNSYRVFRLDGNHTSVTMCDADNTNQRHVKTTDMLDGKPGQTWLTRWSTHASYLTCCAPDGNDSKIWLGQFDDGCTKIKKWVQVSAAQGPRCWQSQAWIAASAGSGDDSGPLIPMQAWTNAEGREIRAAVEKIDGRNVVFRMADGRKVPYPMEKLSAESRKAIANAGGITE